MMRYQIGSHELLTVCVLLESNHVIGKPHPLELGLSPKPSLPTRSTWTCRAEASTRDRHSILVAKSLVSPRDRHFDRRLGL